MITKKQILRTVNYPNINLYKGNGYYYFVYDDGIMYMDHSVYVYTMNELSIEKWNEELDSFVAEIQQKKSLTSLKNAVNLYSVVQQNPI